MVIMNNSVSQTFLTLEDYLYKCPVRIIELFLLKFLVLKIKNSSTILILWLTLHSVVTLLGTPVKPITL